jgi:hypothetical protein
MYVGKKFLIIYIILSLHVSALKGPFARSLINCREKPVTKYMKLSYANTVYEKSLSLIKHVLTTFS